MFTIEEIKLLVKAEQMMDNGEVPYIILDGHRMMVDQEIIDLFCLKAGQTITRTIGIEILRAKISILDREIALRDSEAN